MKLTALLAGAALMFTAGCSTSYHTRIDNLHRCERTGTEDFRLFENEDLIVKKVSKLNDVFDFYDGKKKVGRLSLLPDGTYKWKAENRTQGVPADTFGLIKKCNETLENKYETNFLATEE